MTEPGMEDIMAHKRDTAKVVMHVGGVKHEVKMMNTTQIWETIMSTYWNKCWVSGFLQGRVAGDLGYAKLVALSSMISLTPNI